MKWAAVRAMTFGPDASVKRADVVHCGELAKCTNRHVSSIAVN